MAVLNVEINGSSEGIARALQGAIGNLNQFNRSSTVVTQNVSRNIASVNRLNVAGFQNSLRAGEVSLNRFAYTSGFTARTLTSNLNPALNRSRQDFTNIGRVIQDLPFGFIGIQNNLTQLIPSIGALGLGFSVLVSAITFAQTGLSNWTRGLDGNKKAVKGADYANKEYSDTLREVSRAQLDGAKSAQSDLVNLNLLYSAYQNANIPLKERKSAYKQLQEIYPEVFKNIKFEKEATDKTKDAYDKLTESILASAKARAAANLITKNAERQLNNEREMLDLQAKRTAYIDEESRKFNKRVDQQNALYTSQQKGFKITEAARQTQLDQIKNSAKVLDYDKRIFELASDTNILNKENKKLSDSATSEMSKGGTLIDVPAGTVKAAKSIEDIYKELDKAIARTYVQHESTFGEQLQAQLKAYQSAIDAATDAYGRQSKEVQKLQKEQLKLVSGTASNLNSGRKSTVTTASSKLTPYAPGLATTAKDLPVRVNQTISGISNEMSKQLSRAVRKFGEDFYDTIRNLNTQADQTFQGLFTSIVTGLNDSLTGVFLNNFQDKLEDVFDKSAKNLGARMTNVISGIGLAGGLISGATKKTSALGQGLGGALSGAATGAMIGSVIPGLGTVIGGAIGAIGGALSGIFGASKAKKQEKLQEKQLAESEKQTKLLERQNALAYTSSIIGRQTTGGIITGVEVNEFGELITRVSGNSLDIILRRTNKSRQRGL